MRIIRTSVVVLGLAVICGQAFGQGSSPLQFENIAIIGLGQGVPAVSDAGLVVSNIGSSGEDGVRFIAPPHIPLPSTGRFIPPRPNFELSDLGDLVRFDQLGGLAGRPGQLQSQFRSTNTVDAAGNGRLGVDVFMGLGQSGFNLQLFNGDDPVGGPAFVPSLNGQLGARLATEIVDLVSYDIIVPDPSTITLTGTLARPTTFYLDDQPVGIGDRATITSVGGSRPLTSFQSVDLLAANTDIAVAEVLIMDNAPKAFDGVAIEPIGQGQPSVVLNRNGNLVVSNIGSSGQDGVRFIPPPNIPVPSTGRFIPPQPNFAVSDVDDWVRFDQIGGLDGVDGQLQSQFRSTNVGDQLQVDVTMGLGQEGFELQLFRGDEPVAGATLPSDANGAIAGRLATEVVDLISYDIIVPDPNTITLTGSLARPSRFFLNGEPIQIGGQDVLADRATITSLGGNVPMTKFGSVDLLAANTDIAVAETMILDPSISQFDGIQIEPLGQGQPAAALNRNGQLVVSNIGSSGLDGVRFVAPPEIPIPGTGRFIPPLPNISTTEAGFSARFDQIGGLDGEPNQLQSQFNVANDGNQLKVDVTMGMGQRQFEVELFDPDGNLITSALAPADPDTGRLLPAVSTGIVDLASYDIIVVDPGTIRLTGAFASPTDFTIVGPAGSQTFENVARATITNADSTRRLSSFEVIDITAANTPIRDLRINDVVVAPVGPLPTSVYDGFVIEGIGEARTTLQGSNLVVSNIGSSGQDGVRFIAPPNFPFPSTGRFIPPPDNFAASNPGDSIRFDQIGGLDGVEGQLQSQFRSTNENGERLAVEVSMGLGQREFLLELFEGDTLVGSAVLPSENGAIAGNLATEIVDLVSYDIIVVDPGTITLTGRLARPTTFFLDGQPIGVGDRATITNVDSFLQLSSFNSIDIFAENTDITIAQTLTDPPHGYQWGEGTNPPTADDHALIAEGLVKVPAGERVAALSTTVHGGRLKIDGTLATDTLIVHEDAATLGVGVLDGSIASSANHIIIAIDDFVVTGSANFDGGGIVVEDPYPQIAARGSFTHPFLGLRADHGITATSFNQPGDHLGRGIFLNSIALNRAGTEISLSTLSAKQGDVDGDKNVTVANVFTVFNFLRRNGQDFTTGDNDGDGFVSVGEVFEAFNNIGPYDPVIFDPPNGNDQSTTVVAVGDFAGAVNDVAAALADSTTTGTVGDGVPTLVYDPSTGNVSVEDLPNASPSLRGLHIRTTGLNGVVFADELTLPAGAFAISNDLTVDSLNLAFTELTVANIFGDGFDFGDVLATGLSQTDLINELTITFQRVSGGLSDLVTGDILIPEPGSLALMAFGWLVTIVGVSRRRRR